MADDTNSLQSPEADGLKSELYGVLEGYKRVYEEAMMRATDPKLQEKVFEALPGFVVAEQQEALAKAMERFEIETGKDWSPDPVARRAAFDSLLALTSIEQDVTLIAESPPDRDVSEVRGRLNEKLEAFNAPDLTSRVNGLLDEIRQGEMHAPIVPAKMQDVTREHMDTLAEVQAVFAKHGKTANLTEEQMQQIADTGTLSFTFRGKTETFDVTDGVSLKEMRNLSHASLNGLDVVDTDEVSRPAGPDASATSDQGIQK